MDEQTKKTMFVKLETLLDGEITTTAQTAFVRMADKFYEFIKELEKEHTIIAFSYDGSRNLGLVIEKKENKEVKKMEGGETKNKRNKKDN